MKLTVVFTLVSLALCCYSASAVLDVADKLVSGLVPNLTANVVSIPTGVLADLLAGVHGCVAQLTPKVQTALQKLLSPVNSVG